VTITGTDLGVSAQEVEVTLDGSVCEILSSQYVPGKNTHAFMYVHGRKGTLT
jgi:hypothetical protein